MPEKTTQPSESVTREKEEIVNKIHEMIFDLKIDLNEKMPAQDKLVSDSRKKNDEIYKLLNEQIKKMETKADEPSKEMEELKDKLETATKQIKEAQNQAEQLEKEKEDLQKELNLSADKNVKITDQLHKTHDEREKAVARAKDEEKEAVTIKFERAVDKAKQDSKKMMDQIETLGDQLENALDITDAVKREKEIIAKKYERLQEQWNNTL